MYRLFFDDHSVLGVGCRLQCIVATRPWQLHVISSVCNRPMRPLRGVAQNVHSSQVAATCLAKYWSSSEKIAVQELVA